MGRNEKDGLDLHPSQHTATQCHPQEAVLDADTTVWYTKHNVVQHEKGAAPPLPKPGTGLTTATLPPPPPGSPAWETMDRPETDKGHDGLDRQAYRQG